MSITELYDKYLASSGVSTDSRSVSKDQIFFALKGDNFNGNAYASEVISKGARYAVVDEAQYHIDSGHTILVNNVLETLQQLARHHRRTLALPVIALTGTNGKTTTKELMVAVLSQKHKVHATKGNFNNHIGVPLTILAAKSGVADLMIIEMGANGLEDIKELCAIAEPDYGLITNIGHAHLEGFGSYQGVIVAKTELYKYIQSHGKLLFYNEDDPVLIEHLSPDTEAIPYGSTLEFHTQGLFLCYTHVPTQKTYMTQLSGSYNKDNIRAAAAVGRYFEVPELDICKSIADYLPTMNRSELNEIKNQLGDFTLIMDAYNANPTSMKAAISSFADLDTRKPKVLILGDMKELGKDNIRLHRDVLECLEAYVWKEVVLVGQAFEQSCIGRGAGDRVEDGASCVEPGEQSSRAAYRFFENIEALSRHQNEILTMLDGSIALVKASRSMKLERIKEILL